MTDSHTLLASYARTGSESAFRELVSRYIDLVYSTAFRLVGGDAQSAQDVAQTVFVALAAKAGTLPKDVMLGGWLHQHTRFVAGKLMRTERRRQLRERQAAEMNAIEDHSQSNLAQVAPVLDEAIGQLDADDRTAILLRFFERKDFRGVGEALGSSDDAARKRVDRALEKLHVLLKHRGATLSAAALGTALATEAVTAAPVGLAGSVAGTALASAAAGGGAMSNTFHFMATSNVKLIGTVVVIAALSVPLVLLFNQNASLRRELAARRASALESAPTSATNSGAIAAGPSSDELRRLRKEHLELLSLRGRVTLLANELRGIKSIGAPASASQNPALDEKAADSIILTATTTTNRVTSGHTLVMGGWSMLRGRGYLLITPVIGEGDTNSAGRQITFQGQVVQAPESFWNEIGWGSYKSDSHRSSLSGELTPEQVGLLVEALKGAEGFHTSTMRPTTTSDGGKMGYGLSRSEDDGTGGALMGVDFHARISPDGLSVDLEMLSIPLPPDIPIHSSLK